MADIDRRIDELYHTAPSEFTAARTALAKTLTGDAARQVKALRKPSAVAWAVNQVFWKARPVYDALMKSGRALRTAQIAALKGRKSDVREASDQHRRAVAEAARRARQIADGVNVHPDADHLARMFEALSLAAEPAENAGRFTDAVQPSGFGALAGVKPVAIRASARTSKARKEKEDRRQAREADARLKAAGSALARARDKADAARRVLNRAEAEVADAEREVDAAQEQVQKHEA